MNNYISGLIMSHVLFNMKQIRHWILAIIALVSFNQLNAQYINGVDTICLGNPLVLSTSHTASSYYWGFCSAYLNNIPTGSSIAAGTGLSAPASIAMDKDSDQFYVFVVNSTGAKNMLRYDFTNLLSNAPTPVNLGTLGNKIPSNPRGMQLIKVGGDWFGFLLGGSGPGDYHIVRIEFGSHLSNTPSNVVDMGDLGGSVIDPRDMYIFRENFRWNAVVFGGSGDLYHLDFGIGLTNTPTVNYFGNFGSEVTGMWPMFDGSTWHLFYVNKTNHSVYRLDMGMALSLPVLPLTANLVMGGTPNFPFNDPRDISIIKDCSNYYGYVTNEGANSLTILNFGTNISGIPTASNIGNFAGFNQPGYLTRFIRDKDNVFAYTANAGDNSISRLEYNSCVASSIPNYYQMTPPPIIYSTPGSYNVYYAADEGLPTMAVDCKLITVLPEPIIELSHDTLICQRDTLLLVANGFNLASVEWNPVYNGRLPFDTTSIFVAPEEDYTYNVHLEFLASGGCAYDRAVHVTVGKVTADAGTDRFVADGAYTTLGGPRMSYGTDYTYDWKPQLWLDQYWVPNPNCKPVLASPLNDAQQYIVTVTDTSTQCWHRDTVWVYTECTQINMPNVFNTQSDIPINRKFGLLNTKLAKLEYFRIYNRWGNLVFETTDLHKSWDGTQKNIELPSDNYVWVIDGYCDNGLRVRKQGTVLLVK